ncbi:hypothetical protein [Streptomyces collinus]|uniref:hypothetical protein n=1 Tax=Streptomyces collinus TaxID=42684 RepID=UPI002941BB16|nr:hypothetical protein [Streptomyces collinus]
MASQLPPYARLPLGLVQLVAEVALAGRARPAPAAQGQDGVCWAAACCRTWGSGTQCDCVAASRTLPAPKAKKSSGRLPASGLSMILASASGCGGAPPGLDSRGDDDSIRTTRPSLPSAPS